jgi:hypothetical protein
MNYQSLFSQDVASRPHCPRPMDGYTLLIVVPCAVVATIAFEHSDYAASVFAILSAWFGSLWLHERFYRYLIASGIRPDNAEVDVP